MNMWDERNMGSGNVWVAVFLSLVLHGGLFLVPGAATFGVSGGRPHSKIYTLNYYGTMSSGDGRPGNNAGASTLYAGPANGGGSGSGSGRGAGRGGSGAGTGAPGGTGTGGFVGGRVSSVLSGVGLGHGALAVPATAKVRVTVGSSKATLLAARNGAFAVKTGGLTPAVPTAPISAPVTRPVLGSAGGGVGQGAGGGTGGGGAGGGTAGPGGLVTGHGGGVPAPPLGTSMLASVPHLVYPKGAQNEGVSGSVRLKMYVSAQGKVTRVDVVGSSGNKALDEYARRAVLRSASVQSWAKPYALELLVDFRGASPIVHPAAGAVELLNKEG